MSGAASIAIAATIVASSLGLTACGGAQKPVHFEDKLVARAAFDLDCPEDKLTVTRLGDRNTAGVEGCGKRATYYNDDNDQWVLNTPTGRPETGETATVSSQPPASSTETASEGTTP